MATYAVEVCKGQEQSDASKVSIDLANNETPQFKQQDMIPERTTSQSALKILPCKREEPEYGEEPEEEPENEPQEEPDHGQVDWVQGNSDKEEIKDMVVALHDTNARRLEFALKHKRQIRN